MKKFLLSAALVCVASIGTKAQTTISQTGGAAPTTGTVACGISQAPASTAENSYYRAYTLNASMDITSVKVGIGSVIGSVPISVKLHKSTGAFPGSYPSGLTQIGTATKTLTATTTAMTVDVPFTTPISVASGDIIVVEVNNAPTATGSGNAYYMGVITGSETGLAYIRAATCSINTPTTFAAVSASANGKIVLDLVAQNLSAEKFFSENFNLYPNPTTDVLNISSKNGLEMKEIRITDMTGKVVKVQKDDSNVNVSNLAAGTYLIDITTKEGKATSKFIKK